MQVKREVYTFFSGEIPMVRDNSYRDKNRKVETWIRAKNIAQAYRNEGWEVHLRVRKTLKPYVALKAVKLPEQPRVQIALFQ